jgi:SAM-dependent methyltransferase
VTPVMTPAEAYEAYYGPAIFTPLTDAVLPHAAIRPGERVVDLACGTGLLTRRIPALVGPAGRVIGVDINPGMLAVARRHGGPAIEWRQGDAAALDLPDAVVDVVTVQQGLQFLPDRAAGVREMRRVLVDDGRAVVAAWTGLDHHPLFASLADAEAEELARHGMPVDVADLVAPFSLGDPAALRELLVAGGFPAVDLHAVTVDARFAEADRFLERLEYAYAAVVPAFAEDPSAFAAYLAAVAERTRDLVATHRHGDEVIIPMHATIAVATTAG